MSATSSLDNSEVRRALLFHPRLQIPEELRRRGDQLPKIEGNGNSASTAVNMINTMVGSGMFALPYCMYLSSPIITIILLIVVAIISYLSMFAVGVVLPGFVDEDSYHSMAMKLCKNANTVRIIDGTICLSLIGVIAMLLVVAYDCFTVELDTAFGDSFVPSRPISGVILCALAFALSLPKSLHGMRFISAVGVLLLMSAWGLVVGTAIIGCDSKPILSQNPYNRGLLVEASTVLGTAMLVFGCHVNLPRLHSELPRETRPKMPLIMAISILVSFAIYLSFSLSAVMSPCFGYGRTANILLSLPHSVPFSALRIGFGVISLTKIPLAVHPIRNVIIESSHREFNSFTHSLVTFAIILLSYVLFLTFSALSDITSVVGAVGVLGSMLFFPSILLYQSSKGRGMIAHSEALLNNGAYMSASEWGITQRRRVSVFLAVCGVLSAMVTLPGIVMKLLPSYYAV